MASKGQKFRTWSKDEKLRIVKRVTENCESKISVSANEGISYGLLSTWVNKYLSQGEERLNNKRKPGNPYGNLLNNKHLTREQQLEYEVMKLRIELERSKKGYQVKGVGQEKEYISINKKNLK